MKIKILIVDDEPEIRETLSEILAEYGYKVVTAESGIRAIEIAREEKFELCLLDFRMPGMDGIETFRELRKLNPELRGVLITAYYTDEIREKAISEGIGEVCEKPVDMEKLFAIIKEVEGKRNAKILIIDDDPLFRSTIRDILAEKGYRVDTASTGEEGIKLARSKSYDFYFIDMKLPGKDGLSTFLCLKEIDPHAKVIMMSGFEEEGERMEYALKKGAMTYFYKPFEIKDLFLFLQGGEL